MRCIALLLVALLFGASAPGALLELWFSTSSSLSPPPAPQNPVLPIDYASRVYLWARTPGTWTTVNTSYMDVNGNGQPWSYTDWVGDVWQGLSLDSDGAIGFSGSISNPHIWTSLRWNTESDFSWASGEQFYVAAVGRAYRCCGGTLQPAPPGVGPSVFDAEQMCDVAPLPGNQGHLYTRLGAITITSAPAGATLFMKLGTGATVLRGGGSGPNWFRFGVGDPPTRGERSDVADMTVVPAHGPPGDLNCDGAVNNQDIDAFVVALLNPEGYLLQYPDCGILAGDFTGDGVVNNQDIDGFVATLLDG